MDKKPKISKIKLYLDGSCSKEEAKMIEKWLYQSPNNCNLMLETAQGADRTFKYDSEFTLEKIMNEIDQTERNMRPFYPRAHLFSADLKRLISKVAAVLLMISTISLLYYQYNSIANEDSIIDVISPAETVTTIKLPDGSLVELNAGSRIKYDSSFTSSVRKVYLEGQAFLKVKRDEKRPFQIVTGEITTNVLGTEFYVNYLSETGNVEVGLSEGKVSVARYNIFGLVDSKVILKPDQWVNYLAEKKELKVYEGIKDKTLWRDGILRLEEMKLAEVAELLENWYGVNILIKNEELNQCKVNGTYKRESLVHVLQTLQFVTDMRYEIDQNQVTIYGGECK